MAIVADAAIIFRLYSRRTKSRRIKDVPGMLKNISDARGFVLGGEDTCQGTKLAL